MITISRIRIAAAAGLLAASALAATAVAGPLLAPRSTIYEGAPPATVHQGLQPSSTWDHARLASTGHGGSPGATQVTTIYEGAPPAGATGV